MPGIWHDIAWHMWCWLNSSDLPKKRKRFLHSQLQMYINTTVITPRWVLLQHRGQTNRWSKRQGRKGHEDLFWTLSVINTIVPNKAFEAVFKVPSPALQAPTLISYFKEHRWTLQHTNSGPSSCQRILPMALKKPLLENTSITAEINLLLPFRYWRIRCHISTKQYSCLNDDIITLNDIYTASFQSLFDTARWTSANL